MGGLKTASEQSGGSKTESKQSGGSKTAGKQSGGSKTASKQSGGPKTASKQSGGSKTAPLPLPVFELQDTSVKCKDDFQAEDMTINGPISMVRGNCTF